MPRKACYAALTMDVEVVFIKRLDEAMAGRYASGSALAKKARITPQAISQWRHRGTFPFLPTFVALADALDVSMDWLAGRTDKREVNR